MTANRLIRQHYSRVGTAHQRYHIMWWAVPTVRKITAPWRERYGKGVLTIALLAFEGYWDIDRAQQNVTKTSRRVPRAKNCRSISHYRVAERINRMR